MHTNSSPNHYYTTNKIPKAKGVLINDYVIILSENVTWACDNYFAFNIKV